MATRPPRKQNRDLIRAPRVLSVGPSSILPLLNLLENIERSTLLGHSIDIDMSGSEEISRSAALLLTAQIERSWTRAPHCVNGYNPFDTTAVRRLHALGFYRHLGFDDPQALSGSEEMDDITVLSGTRVTEDLSNRLEDIAAIARPFFGDDEFVSHIHEALSEAMANIHGHAYMRGIEAGAVGSDRLQKMATQKPTLEALQTQARAEALEKWWIAGHADDRSGELLLCALDHGHSIPVIAPFRMRPALEEFWTANPTMRPKRRRTPHDAELLEAVARARREGYGAGRRGRGFPSMIGLVENEATAGAVTVLSGAGLYEFKMSGAGTVATEKAYALGKRFNGTLIEWRIGGSKGQEQDAGVG